MIWLSRDLVILMHGEALARHGGAPGVRDIGLLESALARPLNRAGYGDPEAAELAAIYGVGIAKNHPFIDGNKRTAYLAVEVFLALNGIRFPVSDADAVVTMLAMAGGEISESDFIAWVSAHAVPHG